MINKNEYTFAGLTMEKISLIYGLFLILWGGWCELLQC